MVKARDVMTINPSVCREDDSVYDAVRIMKEEDCGIVPIVNDHRECIGVITDRDIALKVILNHKNPDNTPIRDVMTRHVHACHADDDLKKVVKEMEKHKVRRILIVDDKNQCVGIISERDIALEDRKKAGEMVQAVLK